MGRRRKAPADARALNGWLVIDKPAGISSAKAVAVIRAALRPQRIGHGGTLDPLASGVLPVALGEATKTVAYAMNGTKQYRFTIRFGEARTTDDAEGDVTATSPRRPETHEIEAALGRFEGIKLQVQIAEQTDAHVTGYRKRHSGRPGAGSPQPEIADEQDDRHSQPGPLGPPG